MTLNVTPADRLHVVARLWADGHSTGEIASTLQCTRNAAAGYVHRAKKRGLIEARAYVPAIKAAPPVLVPPKPVPPRKGPAKSFAPKAPTAAAPCTEKGTVKLADLERHHCRWPCGHPGQPDFAFCGSERLTGSSYCDAHTARAWRSSNG